MSLILSSHVCRYRVGYIQNGRKRVLKNLNLDLLKPAETLYEFLNNPT